MKIKVNKEKCQGHAVCVLKSPDVYVLEDDGYNRMDEFTVPKEREADARRGARACPERAIQVKEEE